MKIVVLGAGSMGCLFGGSLAEQGNEVVFIDVSQKQIEAINNNGLKLVTDIGTRVIKVPAKYAKDVDEKFDFLIIFTKTIHSRAALAAVKHLLDGKIKKVLSLQNGLGNIELLEDFVSKEKIVMGTTDFAGKLVKPGEVHSHGNGFTAISDVYGKPSELTKQLCEEITKGGLNCKITKSVFEHIWEKVAFNCAMNTVTAITSLKIGDLFEAGGKQLVYDLAAETIAIANKKGIEANYETVKDMLDNSFKHHPGHVTSLLQDILLKRQTEIEFISGTVSKEGEKLGMNASLNRFAFEVISILQKSYDKRLTNI